MRVLFSFGSTTSTANPYLRQLVDAVRTQQAVDVDYFSWSQALWGRYDVLHLHWPEIMLEGRTAGRRWVRRLRAVALCLRLALTRMPVVRTWHNLERPSGISRVDHAILSAFDWLTTVRVRINDSGPVPSDRPVVTIQHGHYRDWFSTQQVGEAVPGRIAFVGRVRRYKGVEALVDAFRALDADQVSLVVAGMPSTPEMASDIHERARGDQRIRTRFEYLDDAAFVEEITAAQLVVLPYRHMHNSGMALAALSLGRPVLVPDNEVNRRLSDEVGHGWVHLFEGDITSERLLEAVSSVDASGTDAPDLGARDWTDAGREHVKAYAQAIDRRVSSRKGTRR